MSWIDPPNKITECRDAIIACAASSTLGLGSSAQFHYPDAGLKSTALPFAILNEDFYRAERHAPGESYAEGSISLTCYLDPAVITTGIAEQAGRDLAHQLAELTGGNLLIRDVTRSLCSRVRKAKIAATVDGAARSYFTMQMTIAWEG